MTNKRIKEQSPALLVVDGLSGWTLILVFTICSLFPDLG
jgi:hypothetical protein